MIKPMILVIGSSNTDMVVKTSRFPQPGETIIGGNFFMFPGGKGANQAVAAARLGGHVSFICKVGDDIFGKQAIEGFVREGIDTTYCLSDAHVASGVALITVNATGENEIVVAPGANGGLSSHDLDAADVAFSEAGWVLLQCEIPMATVEYAVEKAYQRGKRVILNPAPAQLLTDKCLGELFLISPNETEAELLTGIGVTDLATAEMAAQKLLDKGVENVVITLGAQGAFFKNAQHQILIPAPAVKAVDTTAAGDVFNGAIAVALSEGLDWPAAISFANRAAAVSVTRMGAQASAPYSHEL